MMSSTTDPNAVKRFEKTTQKEAKAVEKNIHHALKDLKSTEKSDAKASKVTLLRSCFQRHVNIITIF